MWKINFLGKPRITFSCAIAVLCLYVHVNNFFHLQVLGNDVGAMQLCNNRFRERDRDRERESERERERKA
jgi:hypothetical protein